MNTVLECIAWFGGATVLTTVAHIYIPKALAWLKRHPTDSGGPG